MTFLKNHPFAVEAFFRQSLVLTFALPAATLRPLLPPPLSLDTHEDRYGFIAVAMVQTHHLRPKGFPRWLGNNFFLVGYRIFVRYTNQLGKRLRGLYILESQTDRRKMVMLGNLMTHYNYSRIKVSQRMNGTTYAVSSSSEGFLVEVSEVAPPLLPQQGVFSDWKTARRFAGPLPFTFTYLKTKQAVLTVQGKRQHWQPQPVTVTRCHLPWLEHNGFQEAQLSSAFVVKDIPYSWEKGKLENWPV